MCPLTSGGSSSHRRIPITGTFRLPSTLEVLRAAPLTNGDTLKWLHVPARLISRSNSGVGFPVSSLVGSRQVRLLVVIDFIHCLTA